MNANETKTTEEKTSAMMGPPDDLFWRDLLQALGVDVMNCRKASIVIEVSKPIMIIAEFVVKDIKEGENPDMFIT